MAPVSHAFINNRLIGVTLLTMLPDRLSYHLHLGIL